MNSKKRNERIRKTERTKITMRPHAVKMTVGTKYKPEFKDLFPVDNSVPEGPKIGQVIYQSEEAAIAAKSDPQTTTEFSVSSSGTLGYTQDALGRYRPNYKKADKPTPAKTHPPKDGAFSTEVERIAATGTRIKRDGTFRARVLGTYGMNCVMCGYSNHVEAAHLDPKHAISDDRTENGAPLCPNHHWELDHALLTADEVRRKRDAN